MIRARALSKAFGGTRVLDAIDLDIAPGAFVALLGPSGSGKSTLLRILAGLEQADSGTLEIDGQSADRLRPAARKVGFVFQNYALFGHMSVFENVAFGLRVRPRRTRPRARELRARVEALLALVRLDGLGPRLPAQLSGGQRQRVALARALAIEPRILLLDEPFGALDRAVREELRAALRALHERFAITTLFVSHDEEEALALADRVVVLKGGRIVSDMHLDRVARHIHPAEIEPTGALFSRA